ncbi:predicted protein [Nematostella vectensis]|uniref:Uncharacterized protein n=1 Tax=Nematostella vectensis TaxID=45351 RepID=A7SMX1_NEMVE|nr:predicted protein [Nematostella vectensis]|eukprot:XP_001627046.1 predicted protein [Nematostella vectensis]
MFGIPLEKAYAKALFCIKTVTEAMERLMFEKFIEDEEVDVTNPVILLNLVQECNHENLDHALQDPSTVTILEKYEAFQDKVRNGYLGKTATFWLSVIDQARLNFMLQYAVKTNNLGLFHLCNANMADLFFAFDGPNYTRYLVWFDLFLTNIEQSHPGAKVLQYREQSDLAFMLLVKSQFLEEPVDLDELMTYSLTPVPHSLGTPDGFLNKTNKATILHFLTDDYDGDTLYPSGRCLYIQDGNALFHSLTQLPPTFGEICLQMLDQMVAKKDFIFSTDSYHENSIKSQERIRRGSSPKYIVDGPATRKPAEFKLFLSNDANKVQLCRLLLRVWGSSVAASRLEKCDRGILVVEGKA